MKHRGKIGIMIVFFMICVWSALMTYHARVQRENVAHRELYEVVCRQLRALRDDDFNRAYGTASSGVQGKFSLNAFTDMIRTNYSSFVEAPRVELGRVQTDGDRAFVQVFFIDSRSGVHPCIYTLIYEGDSWKIDGARMMPRWPSGQPLSGPQA